MIEVYCLPGTMCTELLWQELFPFLPKHIVLKHVTLPVVSNLSEMVSVIISQLPDRPVNLLGFSLGGYLVSEIARLAPERIERAMVLSNSASELPETEKQQRQQALEWVLKSGYRGIPMKKAKAMLLPEHAVQERLLQIILDMDGALGEAVFVAQLQATLERRNNVAAIEESGRPWQVLAGLGDQFVSSDALKQIAQLSNVSVKVVAQSGHMLPLEQPKWVANKMANFFV
ncbi:Alpha/beta hydrolase family protein [Marinomonas aquimarina]|uniref:Alpha/beta hydrolase family protein n=1 Tax=Marinomonas aquimarina TaxID=295068 RepID=A0A1A8TFX9_9GAMM|nr:alpha/beta fold hydrolase [Marinomonas aquimarina]SBS31990.1 Alpha/beta hydrolase family protein [Marinomonas aquimarina]